MRAVVFAYSNVGERCLRLLVAMGVDVPLVVTHRDRSIDATWQRSVATTATELGLHWVTGDDPADPTLAREVARARPHVIFSFYYRALIPTSVLGLASIGAYNLHGSLLPLFRGRAPTNWAVLTGATETGATLHLMVEAPDAGPIVDQIAVPILPDDTGHDVFTKVTVAAEQVLWRSLPRIAAGDPPRHANRIDRGSYFGGRTPEDGRIDWSRPAADIYNLIRAVAPPYPGAFSEINGVRVTVARARRRAATDPDQGGVGGGLAVREGRIVGICGDGGVIDILELWQGRRLMRAGDLSHLLQGSRASAPE